MQCVESSRIQSLPFQIQKVSDESLLEKIEMVLGRMDDDRDGSLKVEDVLKVGIDGIPVDP